MPVRIEIEGMFATRDEAAEALRDVARLIDLCSYSATVGTYDNPSVSVTEVEEDDDGEGTDAR